jgi:predicted RNA-binding Zn-ribbon protein involved in translation (DUF1610 family)
MPIYLKEWRGFKMTAKMKVIKELTFEDCPCPMCTKKIFLIQVDTRNRWCRLTGYNIICKECGFGDIWNPDIKAAVREIKLKCYKEQKKQKKLILLKGF